MKMLENRLPPPLLTMIVAIAMWATARGFAPIPIDPILHVSVTALCSLVALAFGGSGVAEFRRRRTTIDPVNIDQASQVVTSGIYRLTRNPMYVGLTGLLTTWAIWLAVPWTFLGPVFFALFINRFQIRPEERVMAARFGPDYAAYRQRVRRWL